jgi:hypothetical protein
VWFAWGAENDEIEVPKKSAETGGHRVKLELNLFPGYRTSKCLLKENERMNLQLGKPNVEQRNLKYSGVLDLKQTLSGMLKHDQPSLNNRLC